MMTSYFNLLKYAATGQASPDMTYYDKMRASTLMGGVVQTLTGQPPLTFKADGTPLISWSMKGNGSQQGTPTPDAPIMPEFVGVRTGNLFDKANPNVFLGYYNPTSNSMAANPNNAFVYITLIEGMTYYIKGAKRYNTSITIRYCTTNQIPADDVSVVRTGTFSQSDGLTITAQSGESYLAIFVCGDSDYSGYGSVESALAANCINLVIDNGYKIPITCAGQTIPVYLGEVPTVRRVRKLVLTGEEFWRDYNGNIWSDAVDSDSMQGTTCICTHLVSQRNSGIYISNGSTRLKVYTSSVSSVATTAEEWAQYLQQQYSAGHPVTVWYVLANEQTGIVNEPICKIGDYADELHSEDAAVTIPTAKGQNTLTVDTPIQPSEMTITFKG